MEEEIQIRRERDALERDDVNARRRSEYPTGRMTRESGD